MANEDEIIDRCEVEWENPKNSVCRPHECELSKYHEGKHVCSCGWERRLLYRDEPERYDKTLR
jgi:hypothetical protein